MNTYVHIGHDADRGFLALNIYNKMKLGNQLLIFDEDTMSNSYWLLEYYQHPDACSNLVENSYLFGGESRFFQIPMDWYSRYTCDKKTGYCLFELRRDGIQSKVWVKGLSANSLKKSKPYRASLDARCVHFFTSPKDYDKHGVGAILPYPMETEEFHFYIRGEKISTEKDYKVLNHLGEISESLEVIYHDDDGYVKSQLAQDIKRRKEFGEINGVLDVCKHCKQSPLIAPRNSMSMSSSYQTDKVETLPMDALEFVHAGAFFFTKDMTDQQGRFTIQYKKNFMCGLFYRGKCGIPNLKVYNACPYRMEHEMTQWNKDSEKKE